MLEQEGSKSCHRSPGCSTVWWPVGSTQGTPRVADDLLLFILPNLICSKMPAGGSPHGKAGATWEAGLSPFTGSPTGTVQCRLSKLRGTAPLILTQHSPPDLTTRFVSKLKGHLLSNASAAFPENHHYLCTAIMKKLSVPEEE